MKAIPSNHQIARAGPDRVPALIADAGDRARWRFIEFFTANIRSPNTRRAYARAVSDFFRWCETRRVRSLEQITPTVVAGYIERRGTDPAKPSVKQHLAAIRMLFDWLVTGQVVPTNPAHSVRGPKHVVKKGKTPILTREETRALLDSIDVESMTGLRDRALIATMVYSFARIGAVLAMPPDLIEELAVLILAICPLAERLASDAHSAEDRELLRAKARRDGVFHASTALNCLCTTAERATGFEGKAEEAGAMECGQEIATSHLIKKLAAPILAVRPLAEQFVSDGPRSEDWRLLYEKVTHDDVCRAAGALGQLCGERARALVRKKAFSGPLAVPLIDTDTLDEPKESLLLDHVGREMSGSRSRRPEPPSGELLLGTSARHCGDDGSLNRPFPPTRVPHESSEDRSARPGCQTG